MPPPRPRFRRQEGRESGAKLDVKAFHAAVLEHGALPLTELKNVVEEWIAGGGH
jgi:uncharacterized protein (DUF885 family)